MPGAPAPEVAVTDGEEEWESEEEEEESEGEENDKQKGTSECRTKGNDAAEQMDCGGPEAEKGQKRKESPVGSDNNNKKARPDQTVPGGVVGMDVDNELDSLGRDLNELSFHEPEEKSCTSWANIEDNARDEYCTVPQFG